VPAKKRAATYAAATRLLRDKCSHLGDDDLALAVLKKWPGLVGKPTKALLAWAAVTDEIARRDRSLAEIVEARL
jgi:hypothetical protein